MQERYGIRSPREEDVDRCVEWEFGRTKSFKVTWWKFGVGNPTHDGRTLLMIASNGNQLPVVRYLVSNNVELNVVSKFGWIALHYAVSNAQTETALALLEGGIDHTIVEHRTARTAPACRTKRQSRDSHRNRILHY